MRALFTFLVVLPFALAAPRALSAEPVDLELVLAVDVSGSVDGFEARLQRNGYVAAFADPLVLNAIQSGPLGRIAVTYFEWAGFGHTVATVPWTLIASDKDAQAFAEVLNERPIVRGRFTSISGAIGFATALLDQSGFEGARRVIDISGDGPNNIGPLVTTARDRAARQAITINGLPIVNDRPQPFGLPQIPDLDLYFESCVIGGPGAFIVVAESFEDFGSAIRRKLILEIAGLTPREMERRRAGRLAPRYLLATHEAPQAPQFREPDCLIGERRLRQFQIRPPGDFQ